MRADTSRDDVTVIVDSIPQMVWLTDPRGEAVYHNRRCQDFFGLPTEALRGGDWKRVIHPDDRSFVSRAWDRSWQTGAPFEEEYRIRRADGAFRWNIGRSAPQRDGHGRILRWFGTFTEIAGAETDLTRRRLEEQLCQHQEIEALTRLVGGIAHTFNNLHNIILGYSQFLLGNLAANDPSREAVEEIRQAGERAASLTRELLTFSGGRSA